MANNGNHTLITGGAGFIGSHLARAILKTGQRVTVIDDMSTGGYANLDDLEHNPNFRLYVDTIRDLPLMDQLMQECGTVYHLASSVGVKLIMEQPVNTIDNIYRGTEMVLRLARRYRNRVLITSTSEVYGKSNDVPFREDGDRVEGLKVWGVQMLSGSEQGGGGHRTWRSEEGKVEGCRQVVLVCIWSWGSDLLLFSPQTKHIRFLWDSGFQ